MIEFTIPGEPKGKARPRLGRGGHTYTPRDTRQYEHEVAEAYYRVLPQDAEEVKPIEGPVAVEITAYFGIPRSKSKKERLRIIRENVRPTKKPDIDNIEKIICDALNGIAYRDDSQVTDSYVRKRYVSEDEEPRVCVMIMEV